MRVTISVLWSGEMGKNPVGELRLGGAGLFGVSRGKVGDVLHCLSREGGGQVWQVSLAGMRVVGVETYRVDDGWQVVVSGNPEEMADSWVKVFNEEGQELWTYTNSKRLGTPIVVGDQVWVASQDKRMLKLDLVTGGLVGETQLPVTSALSKPLLTREMVYVPCRGSALLACSLIDNSVKKFVLVGEQAWLSKAPVLAGRNVVTGTKHGRVVAFTQRGHMAWDKKVTEHLGGLASDGERVFVTGKRGVHGLDGRTGREIWHVETKRRVEATPVVRQGVVYAVGYDYHVYGIGAESGEVLWKQKMGGRIEVSPAVSDDGRLVYVADRHGVVSALSVSLPEQKPTMQEPVKPPPKTGLKGDILRELREVLLRCGSFDNYRDLQSVFVDSRIARWRNELPFAQNPARLVDQTIDFLHLARRADGKNGLILFLQVLGEKASDEDSCGNELLALAKRLSKGGYEKPVTNLT